MQAKVILACGCPFGHKHSDRYSTCLEYDCRVCKPSECGRHGNLPVLRCTHIGDAFVVHMAAMLDAEYIDYVFDLQEFDPADDGVIVESHYIPRDRKETVSDLWNELNEKMRSGEPPNPDL